MAINSLPWLLSEKTSWKPKVVVVMPAYNAGRTLRMTYEELPKDTIHAVILVDDGSTDETLQIARDLKLEVFVHDRNYGYGANQKTCYAEAVKAGADIIVMVHPDYQYDPRLVPQIIAPLLSGEGGRGSRLATQGEAPPCNKECPGGNTTPIGFSPAWRTSLSDCTCPSSTPRLPRLSPRGLGDRELFR